MTDSTRKIIPANFSLEIDLEIDLETLTCKDKISDKILANCSPYFTTLQYINNLETKRSYKRTVYLNTLKFSQTFIERFKNYSLIC